MLKAPHTLVIGQDITNLEVRFFFFFKSLLARFTVLEGVLLGEKIYQQSDLAENPAS